MMKNITIYTLIALATLLTTTPLVGQQASTTKLSVTPSRAWQKGDKLNIEMQLNLNSLQVGRDRTLTVTPMLVSENNSIELPYILINGKERHKVYKRGNALGNKPVDTSLYTELIAGDSDKLMYKEAIAYEPWMANAHLDLREDWCNCGKHAQETATQRVVTNIELEKKPEYTIRPHIAYLQPKVTASKSRNMEWEVYLDFRVNKTDIVPEYMNNYAELSKIESMLEQVSNDKHIDVTRIDIVGYASPEGSLANNERLSKGRAEALKAYLLRKSYFSSDIYHVKYGGENWDGLVDMVEVSAVKDKDEVLSLINNTNNREVLKKKLQTLKNGVPYRDMLANVYPKLRKVVCQVNFNIHDFNVEEAKEVMKTQPEYLSLSEFYQIANSYPEGSSEYANVYEVMIRMFPHDEVANLNAAAEALSRKDLVSAKKYLDKANVNAPEYINNLGVYYILQGEIDKAKDILGKSTIDEAKYNLKEVEKKLEIEK